MKKLCLFIAVFVATYILCGSVGYAYPTGWSNDVRIADIVAVNPDVSYGRDTTVHVVFQSGGNIWYYRSSDNGKTWPHSKKITSTGDPSSAGIVADYKGNVHVVWMAGPSWSEETFYRRSTDNGNTWGDITLLSEDDDTATVKVCIAVSEDTTVHVAWHETPNKRDFWVKYIFSPNAGNDWSPEREIAYWDAALDYPDIAALGNLVGITWETGNLPTKGSEGYGAWFSGSTNGGSSWSTPKDISDADAVPGMPDIAIDRKYDNRLHITWVEHRDPLQDQPDIYYRTSGDAGVNWTNGRGVSEDRHLVERQGTQKLPDLACDPGGIHLVWQDDSSGNWEIFYYTSPDSGDNWEDGQGNPTPLRLVYHSEPARKPEVSASFGTVHVIWEDKRDGEFRAYYKQKFDVVPPAAPTGLHAWCEFAAFPGFVIIHLAWDPNSEPDLEGYNVYHQPDGGDWGLLKTTTDTTASHIVRYETVHYYYVTAFDFAENESDGSDTIRVVARPEASPFVFVWDGTEFVVDNSILPASEIVSGFNTDYYKIERHLEEQNNEYLLQIIESGNHHTYLDQMKLLAVDHPAELSIGTTSDGEIIAYEETASPISCEDNYGNDWLDSVNTLGNGYYSSEDGGWLDLDFGEVDWEERAVIVGTWMAAKFALHIQIQEDDEWKDVGIIYPRAMYSTTLVNLSEFDFDGKVRIYCEGNAVIDYVALAESEMEGVKIRECPLKTAIHSEEGSVKKELLDVDEDYAEIMPRNTINLAFNAIGKQHDHVRDFVLVSTGYYEHIKGMSGTMSAGSEILSSNFELCGGYPNPLNSETQIKFAIPEEAQVSLGIYDVTGRLVATLVSGKLEAGYHTITWQPKGLASGIYFAKLSAYTGLEAESHTKVKKLIIVK
jgi:hypothetical protein